MDTILACNKIYCVASEFHLQDRVSRHGRVFYEKNIVGNVINIV